MSHSIAQVVVHFPATWHAPDSVQLRVQLENTAEADAPAVVVARLTLDLRGVDWSAVSKLLFEIPYAGRASELSVSAFLASDVGRSPTTGDLITVATVRVVPEQLAEVHLVEYRR